MNTALGVMAILAAAAAVAAEPGEDPVQGVIDAVEQECREGPVYMIGPKKAERLAELVHQAKAFGYREQNSETSFQEIKS